MKTLMRINGNGDLDLLDSVLMQYPNENGFTISEDYINLKDIIEYPQDIYRNYYVEKNAVNGYVTYDQQGIYKPGDVVPSGEGDMTSDFINVSGWENVTIRIRFLGMNGSFKPYVSISTFDADKKFKNFIYDEYPSNQRNGNFMYVLKVPINIDYIRVCCNYNNIEGVTVKKTVERGLSDNIKYYKSFEDMPDWVKKTDSPVSFFEQGIVIKGDIIKDGEIVL